MGLIFIVDLTSHLLIGGVITVFLWPYTSALSMVIGRAIDISGIVPVLWTPFIAAALWYTWQRINAALIKPGAVGWNTMISLEKVVFRPMSEPLGGLPDLCQVHYEALPDLHVHVVPHTKTKRRSPKL